MQDLTQARRRMALSLALSTVGSCITFTGLPVFVARATGDLRHSAGLFAVEAIASVSVSILGGTLADRFGRKNLTIVPALISGAIMVAFGLTFRPDRVALFYVAGFLVALLNSLGSVAESAWYQDLSTRDRIDRDLGFRSAWLSAAKILGMASGPVLFDALGATAAALDGATYFVAALLILRIPSPRTQIRRTTSATSDLLSGFRHVLAHRPYRILLPLALTGGLMSFPFISAATLIAQKSFDSAPFQVSLFWLCGGLGSFVANAALARGISRRVSTQGRLLLSTSVMAIGVLAMALSRSWSIYLGCYALFTLANPILSNFLQTEVYRRTPPEFRARVLAVQFSLVDLAALFGVSLFAFSSSYLPLPSALLIFLPLIALRGWSAHQASRRSTDRSSA